MNPVAGDNSRPNVATAALGARRISPLLTERKALEVQLKADQDGAFRATFATFNVVDLDGDVTLPGAFKAGAPVRVSQFAHNWGDYIIGDGVLGSDASKAWSDAEFYLDTSRGLDTYRSVKRASAKQLQEWSYGFDVVGSSSDKADLEPFPGALRVLKELKVHEISPVMLGAGIGTGTDFIKGQTLADHASTARAAVDGLAQRYSALAAELRKEGRAISAARISRLREVIANARGSASAIAAAADELEQLLEDAGVEGDDAAKAALQALRTQFIATTRVLATR